MSSGDVEVGVGAEEARPGLSRGGDGGWRARRSSASCGSRAAGPGRRGGRGTGGVHVGVGGAAAPGRLEGDTDAAAGERRDGVPKVGPKHALAALGGFPFAELVGKTAVPGDRSAARAVKRRYSCGSTPHRMQVSINASASPRRRTRPGSAGGRSTRRSARRQRSRMRRISNLSAWRSAAMRSRGCRPQEHSHRRSLRTCAVVRPGAGSRTSAPPPPHSGAAAPRARHVARGAQRLAHARAPGSHRPRSGADKLRRPGRWLSLVVERRVDRGLLAPR